MANPQPTQPTPPQPSPNNMPSLGATPADQGNPNAPANNQPLLAQSGNIQTDPNTGLPVAYVSVNGKLIELVLNSDIKPEQPVGDRKSTRLNSSHLVISYAVFCLKKKKKKMTNIRMQ